MIAVWVALLIVLTAYFQQQHIPLTMRTGVAAAFCTEAALFLALGFESVRNRLSRWGQWRLASAMWASGLAPYLLAGFVEWRSLALLAALAALAAYWFLLLPRGIATDLGYLALLGTIIVWRVFGHIYGDPLPKLPLSILGELMWTRLFIVAALLLRRVEGVGFGFLPTAGEWKVGVLQFLYFLPLGLVLNMELDFADPRLAPVGWAKLAATAGSTFAGVFFFVALREEFVFRGLLQQWLSGWWNNTRLGLVTTAVIFGLVHLPFRQWPNWKFAILATLAGYFYGRAFQLGGGVRAAMVTHALVNTTWRTLMQ